ncbi:MAG TPA: RNA polymerase sigma factor [Gemmatimonadaceae bacterium]|jgi:RNA polymerase sigma-70 factor (ECF subfamily)
MTLDIAAQVAERQEALYGSAVSAHGAALERLARSYEADPDKRQDLLQEIHLALWRSFRTFDEQCSLRTWVFRVGHNVAATHIVKERRTFAALVGLDAIPEIASDTDVEGTVDRRGMLERLFALIHQLRPLDRQVVLLYLEDNDAATIGEITGLSAGNVATKISRLKKVLGQRATRGGLHV